MRFLLAAIGVLALALPASASASTKPHRSGHTHRLCRPHKHARRHKHSCRAEPRAHRSSHGHARHGRSSHGHARAGSRQVPVKSAIAEVLASACQNTELTPEPGNLQVVAAAALCLVNQERARHDELPLRPDARLQAAADEHSEEMVRLDYFAHIAPSGLTPVQRVQGTGYVPSAQDGYIIGENIAWGTLELSTPKAIVAAWIASPEHLANILQGEYRDTAIGVVAAAPPSLAHGQSGAVYSQEFGVVIH